jgi:hypothetical protein
VFTHLISPTGLQDHQAKLLQPLTVSLSFSQATLAANQQFYSSQSTCALVVLRCEDRLGHYVSAQSFKHASGSSHCCDDIGIFLERAETPIRRMDLLAVGSKPRYVPARLMQVQASDLTDNRGRAVAVVGYHVDNNSSNSAWGQG